MMKQTTTCLYPQRAMHSDNDDEFDGDERDGSVDLSGDLEEALQTISVLLEENQLLRQSLVKKDQRKQELAENVRKVGLQVLESVQGLEETRGILRAVLGEIEQARKDLGELQAQCCDLRDLLRCSEQDVKTKVENIRELDETIRRLQDNIEKQDMAADSVKKEYDKLQDRFKLEQNRTEQLNTKVGELSEQLRKAENEKSIVEEQLSEVKKKQADQMTCLMTEIQSISSQNDAHREKESSLLERLSTLETEMEVANHTIQENGKAMSGLHEQLRAQENEISQNRQEMGVFEDERNRLLLQNEHLKSKSKTDQERMKAYIGNVQSEFFYLQADLRQMQSFLTELSLASISFMNDAKSRLTAFAADKAVEAKRRQKRRTQMLSYVLNATRILTSQLEEMREFLLGIKENEQASVKEGMNYFLQFLSTFLDKRQQRSRTFIANLSHFRGDMHQLRELVQVGFAEGKCFLEQSMLNLTKHIENLEKAYNSLALQNQDLKQALDIEKRARAEEKQWANSQIEHLKGEVEILKLENNRNMVLVQDTSSICNQLESKLLQSQMTQQEYSRTIVSGNVWSVFELICLQENLQDKLSVYESALRKLRTTIGEYKKDLSAAKQCVESQLASFLSDQFTTFEQLNSVVKNVNLHLNTTLYDLGQVRLFYSRAASLFQIELSDVCYSNVEQKLMKSAAAKRSIEMHGPKVLCAAVAYHLGMRSVNMLTRDAFTTWQRYIQLQQRNADVMSVRAVARAVKCQLRKAWAVWRERHMKSKTWIVAFARLASKQERRLLSNAFEMWIESYNHARQALCEEPGCGSSNEKHTHDRSIQTPKNERFSHQHTLQASRLVCTETMWADAEQFQAETRSARETIDNMHRQLSIMEAMVEQHDHDSSVRNGTKNTRNIYVVRPTIKRKASHEPGSDIEF